MLRPPPRRRLVVCALLVALAPGAHAQVRPPDAAAQQPERFRTGIDIVALDVTVVDRTGKPVRDLTPADFTVTVDGVPRRVAAADFVDHLGGAPSPTTAEDVWANAASAIQPPPPRGRDLVILLHEDSLETEDGLLARRAVLALLGGLPAADRVGINTIPRLRSNFTLTSDRVENRKVLESWVPGVYREPAGQYRIGAAEAFDIAAMDSVTRDKVVARECGALDRSGRVSASCAREVVQEARQLATRLHARGTQALNALRTIGRGLRQLEGPKTVVLVSGGILTPESMSEFGEVEAEFAASQISLYALYFEKTEYHAGRTGVSPTLAADDRMEEDGLANVTSAAGGTFLRVIGTAETYFERVATELSASYLLGIEVAAADRNGKPHRVEITVKRPGLSVRGRKQYVIPADPQPPRLVACPS